MGATLATIRELHALLHGPRIHERTLDSISSLNRVRFSTELLEKVSRYRGDAALGALARLRLATEIRALVLQLGGKPTVEAGEPDAIGKLRAIADGLRDGESLASLFGLMREAINELQDTGRLAGDAEAAAHAAITHWAELETSNAAS